MGISTDLGCAEAPAQALQPMLRPGQRVAFKAPPPFRAALAVLVSLALGLALCVMPVAAQAQSAGVAHPTDAARAAHCNDRSRTLGISRIVEIDTANGLRVGNVQYRDLDFLEDGEVVLTFDDGPVRRFTLPIVEALAAECTLATFFLVGSQAIADPDMVKLIGARGHTIASHTWSHANLRRSNQNRAREEIELGFSAVAAAYGRPISPFFRFPYLADTAHLLNYTQSRNFGVFSIDIDSLDYRKTNAAQVQSEVLRHLATRRKGILLFHDIHLQTAQAIPGLLRELRTRGYRVVHMVPKTAATTLPDMDAAAEARLARRMVASRRSPLADRAMTWPMAEPPRAQPSAVAATPVANQASPAPIPPAQAQAQTPAPQANVLPALIPPTAEVEPPPQRRFRIPEPDWREQIFRN